MSVTVSVRLTANDVISTFSGILDCEWHSRGHRFDPDRLHQSPKALFIAVFRLFLISKSHILLFFFKIIIVIFKPFYLKMSVSMSVKYFIKSWILTLFQDFFIFSKNFKKTICDKLLIPIRTAENWESDKSSRREPPLYVKFLIYYYLNKS